MPKMKLHNCPVCGRKNPIPERCLGLLPKWVFYCRKCGHACKPRLLRSSAEKQWNKEASV